MDYNKVYGLCRGCNKYVDRDSMVSTNFTVFGDGVDEKRDKIRFRLCPRCHDRQLIRWKTSPDGRIIEWRGEIKKAAEIRVNKNLSDQCDDIDFDDSDQVAMFEISKLKHS